MRKPAPIWTDGPQYRAGTADPAGSNGGERIVRYQLSDSNVARDGHTIATAGWVLDNYLKNPIVQWAHALDEPPIGRMVELGAIGDRLMGSIEYPDAETYPFADTIFRLVKGGYINAVSVSWAPISWKYSTDRARPGGIDFLRTELLEVSNVPLPAAPAALATARAAGIDTGPLYDWAEKVLDTGDKVLIPRAEIEALRRAAKMPTPKRANAADEASNPITALVGSLADTIPSAAPAMQRGLWTCAWFLMLLDDLYALANCVTQEEAGEGDDSPAPAAILAAANDLAQAVLGYVSEQIAEKAAGDDEIDGVYMMAAPAAERRAMLPKLLRTLENAPAVAQDAPIVRMGTDAARIVSAALDRAGRVLSAESEADVRAAIDQLTRAGETLRLLLERATPAPEPETEPDPLEMGLARARESLVRLRQVAAD